MQSPSEQIGPQLLKMLKQQSRSFKQISSFQQRFLQYQVIRCNYPGFIPINCELQNYTGPSHINFHAYLSQDILTGHLRAFLKKMLQKKFKQLSKSDNLYLMIDQDVIIKYDITLRQVYQKKAQKDGWLYIKLSIQS